MTECRDLQLNSTGFAFRFLDGILQYHTEHSA